MANGVVLQVLEAISEGAGTVREIEWALPAANRAKVYRALGELLDAEWIDKDGDRYFLGIKAQRLWAR